MVGDHSVGHDPYMKEGDKFLEGLRVIMDERGLKPAPLSTRAGFSDSMIRDLYRKSSSPKLSSALAIADALGLTIEEIVRRSDPQSSPQPTIALAGKVGAGAKVPLFDAYEKGDGPQIECPPAMPSSGVVAVEIEGDSMEPVFSAGDVLFYTRHTHENVPSEAIGRRSVCEDADGNVWVKQVKRGDEPDKFHLISLNPGAQTMWNVALKWASPIRLHWPKELVKKVTN